MSGDDLQGRSPETAPTPVAAAPADPPAPSGQDARLRAKNRLYLIVITVICLIIAAGGWAYTRWLAQQPPASKEHSR